METIIKNYFYFRRTENCKPADAWMLAIFYGKELQS